MKNKGELNEKEFQFLISHHSEECDVYNKFEKWLPNSCWAKIQKLTKLSEKFEKFAKSFDIQELEWEEIYNSTDATLMKFPKPFHDKHKGGTIDPFAKLCILKCIQPNCLIRGIIKFVSSYLGE